MQDDSDPHVAAEISEAVKNWSESTGRPAMLIAESNVYDPSMLAPLDQGGIGFDAEWCDDFLHSVSAVVQPDFDVTFTADFDDVIALRDFAMAFAQKLED